MFFGASVIDALSPNRIHDRVAGQFARPSWTPNSSKWGLSAVTQTTNSGRSPRPTHIRPALRPPNPGGRSLVTDPAGGQDIAGGEGAFPHQRELVWSDSDDIPGRRRFSITEEQLERGLPRGPEGLGCVIAVGVTAAIGLIACIVSVIAHS